MNPKKVLDEKYDLRLNRVGIVTVEGMSRIGLYKFFSSLNFRKGCEVGVLKGSNAVHMFKTIPDLKLFLVDPYKDHPFSTIRWGSQLHSKNMEKAIKAVMHHDATWLIGFSEFVFDRVKDNSLDFVYIDGNHMYDFFMLDIILWTRKVKRNGIVSGHDFANRGKKCAVRTVVEQYTSNHKFSPIYLTDPSAVEAKGDTSPSWFFIKDKIVGYGKRASM